MCCRAALRQGEESTWHYPTSIAFWDVETTGLGKYDRIVSFGGIGMTSRNLKKGPSALEYLYLVFDPGTGNRRGARTDLWLLRFRHCACRIPSPFMLPK